jgi:hypothetical protein
VIGPAIGVDNDRMRTVIIAAVDSLGRYDSGVKMDLLRCWLRTASVASSAAISAPTGRPPACTGSAANSLGAQCSHTMMPRVAILFYPLDLALRFPDAVFLGVTRGPGVHLGQPLLPFFNSVERARFALGDQPVWHYRRLVVIIHAGRSVFLSVSGKQSRSTPRTLLPHGGSTGSCHARSGSSLGAEQTTFRQCLSRRPLMGHLRRFDHAVRTSAQPS